MAEFLEERLSEEVRLGVRVDDDYEVEITRTAGGGEYRHLLHDFPLRRWVINFTDQRSGVISRVQGLYHRARKSFYGFRVRCHDDFTSRQDGISPPTALDQTLLRVSAGVYQLRKAYGTDGPAPSLGYPSRTIYKPVAGTVLVARNGILVTSGVTVDTTNGQVTITPAPGGGEVITGGCEFDIPCRFDSTLSSLSLSRDVRDFGSLDLVELLVP